jgi:hypothetical protein
LKTTTELKKILEISLLEDGLAMAGCELENELDCKRLGAAFIVLAHENFMFRASLLAAADALRKSPSEAKELTELSKRSAAARMFMDPNKKHSN